MARHQKNKPIVELDKPYGKVIKFWDSAKAASLMYNISQVVISYNVNDFTKQAKGHYFRFATSKEIQAYKVTIAKIDSEKSAEPTQKEETIQIPNLPVEIIPEVVQSGENQINTLSPFYRLLEAGKKKLNENSK